MFGRGDQGGVYDDVRHYDPTSLTTGSGQVDMEEEEEKQAPIYD